MKSKQALTFSAVLTTLLFSSLASAQDAKTPAQEDKTFRFDRNTIVNPIISEEMLPATSGPEVGGFTIAVKSDKMRYFVDERVRLTMFIRNVGKTTTFVTRTDDPLPAYTILVSLVTKKPLSITPKGKRVLGNHSSYARGSYRLIPGNSLMERTNKLTDIFDLTPPGNYEITLTRLVESLDGIHTAVSNPIQIFIDPRPPLTPAK